MDKQTIFFSHSSKDSLAILPIKNRINQITANVLDIFMSSDGQSIPFGHNWIHKIEEGLKKAQLMFVFITPNSIDSAWIYFEAGFAYSKSIEVVPVGIGVNISQLKPPLSLLQGFDITSVDSLNNFISVINRKLGSTFNEAFIEDDYRLVFNSVTKSNIYLVKPNDIFSIAKFELYSQYSDSNNKQNIIRYDIEKYFSNIKAYLDEQNIQYAYRNKCIIVGGIQIEIIGSEEEPIDNKPKQMHLFIIDMSMQNFLRSFNLLKQLILGTGFDKYMYFELYFNNDYDCLHNETSISSVISDNEDTFQYMKDKVGQYCFKNKIQFYVNRKELRDYNNYSYAFIITFKIEEVEADDFFEFFERLQKCGFIFKIKQ